MARCIAAIAFVVCSLIAGLYLEVHLLLCGSYTGPASNIWIWDYSWVPYLACAFPLIALTLIVLGTWAILKCGAANTARGFEVLNSTQHGLPGADDQCESPKST
jgi:hypothetical protein